jgi:hypothetical protein
VIEAPRLGHESIEDQQAFRFPTLMPLDAGVQSGGKFDFLSGAEPGTSAFPSDIKKLSAG